LTAYSCGGWSSLPEPTLPGATALARMPYRPSSSAKVLTLFHDPERQPELITSGSPEAMAKIVLARRLIARR
jgi:hypothetical protein